MTLNIETQPVDIGSNLDINNKSVEEEEEDLEDGEILEEGEVPDDDDEEEENNENIKKDDNHQTNDTNNDDTSKPISFKLETNKKTATIETNKKTATIETNKHVFENKVENNKKSFEEKSFDKNNSNNNNNDNKKRKKRWGDIDKDVIKEKKFRLDEDDELINPPCTDEDLDEDELMCVRGASPSYEPHGRDSKQSLDDEYYDYEDEECDEDYNNDYNNRRQQFRGRGGRGRGRGGDRGDRRGGRGGRRNEGRRGGRGGFRNDQDRGGNKDGDQDDGMEGICQYFMQGKCHRGDNCPYSHDATPPRKMELCKFYLLECCAKKDKCLYMHNDFPCKYYHTGLKCFDSEKNQCKFSHNPLDEIHTNILVKHLETAPKEILGDFPRLSRDGALAMIRNKETSATPIPSLFDIKVDLPEDVKLAIEFNQKAENLNDTPIPSGDEEDMAGDNFNSSTTSQHHHHHHPHHQKHHHHSKHGEGIDHHHHSKHDEDLVDDEQRKKDKKKKEKEQYKLEKAKRKAEREKRRAEKEKRKKRKLEEKKKGRKRRSDEDEEEEEEEEEDEHDNDKDDKSSISDNETKVDKKKTKHKKKKKSKINDENGEERREGEDDDNSNENVLSHLPKKQRELFMRIQQHQREADASQGSDTSGDTGNDDEDNNVEEHWYSSDEDGGPTPLSSILKTINQKTKPPLIPHPPAVAKIPLLPTPTDIPNTPGYIPPEARATLANIPEEPTIYGLKNRAQPKPPVVAPTIHASMPLPVVSEVKTDPMMLSLSNININPDDVTRLLSSLQTVPGAALPSSTLPSITTSSIPVPDVSDQIKLPPAIVKRDPRLARSTSTLDQPRPLLEATKPVSNLNPPMDSCLKDIDLRLPNIANLVSSTSNDVDLRSLPFEPVPMHEACIYQNCSLTSHPPMKWKLIPNRKYYIDYSDAVTRSRANPKDPRIDPNRTIKARRVSLETIASPRSLPNVSPKSLPSNSPISLPSSSPNILASPSYGIPPTNILPRDPVLTRDPRKIGQTIRSNDPRQRNIIDPRVNINERRTSDPKHLVNDPRINTHPDPRQSMLNPDPRQSILSLDPRQSMLNPDPIQSMLNSDPRQSMLNTRLVDADSRSLRINDPRINRGVPSKDNNYTPLSYHDRDLRTAPSNIRGEQDIDLRQVPTNYHPH